MMKHLRVGYFADGPWSHGAAKLLAEDPTIDIAFIVPRAVTPDQFIIEFASMHEIPCYLNSKINSEAFIEIAQQQKCDLFISMSFDQIFKPRTFELPPLGTINCHAGKLPFYRGRNVLNWVLINNEKEFGITVHYVDEGIDSGDIILQEKFPINDHDNYHTLLLKSYEQCPRILYEAVKKIQRGNPPRIRQHTIDRTGSYCRKRGPGDEIIDWNQTSRQLFNFIRAICRPGPLAHTTLHGKTVKINKAVIPASTTKYKGAPGDVVGGANQHWIVKTLNGVIELSEIESEAIIKTGDRLGS